ncbi:MAG: hypothetical protein JXB13_00965 [Phycisphaerae bacterium]|nr:hypothetical protein [Phycisphaerae bacterium]
MDAGQTNVVGTEEVVERLRRMIAEYRRHEGEDAFGDKAKNKKQKAKMRDEGTEGPAAAGRLRDEGDDGSIAIDNPRSSSLRASVPSCLRASAYHNSQFLSGVPTGLDTLDTGLPWGGLPLGAVSQVLDGGPGVGAMSLALAVAGRAARGDDTAGPGWAGRGGVEAESARPIVVIDPAGDFYPPAVVKFGLDPQRLLVVRPGRALDAVWAADQCLRCPAVAAVVARLERLGRVHSRRLQLAAEAGGGIGLVVTPLAGRERTFVAVAVALDGEVAFGDKAKSKKQKAKMRDEGTRRSGQAPGRRDGGEVAFGGKARIRRDEEDEEWAAIEDMNPRALIPAPRPPDPRPRVVRVTVLKVREGIPAEPFVVGLDDEAGFMPVHAVVESGAAGAGRRRAGA